MSTGGKTLADGSGGSGDKCPMHDLSSPYYLHPSDHPGLTICSVALKGDNYREWTTAMRHSFRAKRKLGFIDGSIPLPKSDSPEYDDWYSVNSMLVGWIVQTVDPSLRSSITYFDSVKELWDDLAQRFSVGNGPRVLQLRAEIATLRMNGQDVAAYYGSLKRLWEELDSYVPPTACVCGHCSCNVNQKASTKQDEERVHQFLIGLDDNFATMRSNVLAQEPLLPLAKVYSFAIQDEKVLSMMQAREPQADSVAFAARRFPSPTPKSSSSSGAFVDRKSLTCTHCGRTGHDKPTCFQITGFPDWCKPPKGVGRGSTSDSSSRPASSAGVAAAMQPASTTGSSSVPSVADRSAFGSSFTPEQWASVRNFCQSLTPDSTSDKLSGLRFQDSDWSG